MCQNIAGSRAEIYREGDLVHYIFAEAVGKGIVLGICLIFNGVEARQPKSLFEYMKQVIEAVALKSRKFIEYDADGNIVFNVAAINDDQAAYDFLRSEVNSVLDGSNDFDFQPLPTKYGGPHKTKYLNFSKSDFDILSEMYTCNCVVIEDPFGIERNAGHKVIKGLQKKLAEKEDEITGLRGEISALEKKKKQFKAVMILAVILLGCCVGLGVIYNNLTDTQDTLSTTRSNLRAANDNIKTQNQYITSLRDQVANLESTLAQTRRERDEAQTALGKIEENSSLIITGASREFGDYNKKYKFNYYSTFSGNKKLKIKVFNENRDHQLITTKEIEPYFNEGVGDYTVYLPNTSLINNGDWMLMLIYDGNRIIGGSRH